MMSRSLWIETFTAQKPVDTTDGMGGSTRTWADHFTFKGRLSTLGQAETLSADKFTVFSRYRLFCAYNSELDETWRIGLGSRTFEIKGIARPSNVGHQEILLEEIK